MYEYYLSLGSNLGNREENFKNAIKLLSEAPGINLLGISNIYETAPVGYTKQGDFLNMAIKISSDKYPLELLRTTQAIEKKLKRKRTIRFGPRTIDIDILLCEGVIMDTSELVIPHPRMFEREFVMLPLKDIYSEFEPPISINELHDLKSRLKIFGKEIIHFNSIDSTNNYAKKIAKEGAREGTLIIANTQTAGRGRLGRQFSSNSNKGIWMSIILRPKLNPIDAQNMTIAAGRAVVKAIKQVTGIDADIKWPNDVLVGGKKVCGILTESECEAGNMKYMVLGIGLNVNHQEEDFSEELRDIATSLRIILGKDVQKEDVIVELLYQLESLMLQFDSSFDYSNL